VTNSKNTLNALINALILTATALVSLCLCASDKVPIQPSLVSDTNRAHRAVDQLVRTQLTSGLFPYDFDFTTGNETDMGNIEGINLVRQTGAAFALGEYLTHFDHGPARKTLKVFLKNSISNSLPVSKGYTQRTLEWLGFYNRWQLWHSLRQPLYKMGLLFSKQGSAQLVSTGNDYERAWAGATALSIIAAIKYHEATGDTQFNDAINHWKDGLLALKVPRRGFREAPHFLTENPYVNAEAWLAFAELERIFPGDDDSKAFLSELDQYMIQTYGNNHNQRFYSWGMMAAVVRAEVTGDERFTDFIYRMTKFYLDVQNDTNLPNYNSCASVEGLATFVAFMHEQGREKDPLVLRASDYVVQIMDINRKLQIDKRTVEALPNGKRFVEKLKDHRGAFIMSLKEPLMQVDLTQHCLNTMLRMYAAGLAR